MKIDDIDGRGISGGRPLCLRTGLYESRSGRMGTHIGVKAHSQVEFNATTKQEKNSSGYLQYYGASN